MREPLDPSDHFHAFTPKRLGVIARVLWETRELAASTALWEDGANKLSVGLNAWLFACKRLTKLAAAGTYGWLSVSSEKPYFVITMGGVPLRFCSGDDESPLRAGYRFPSASERRDLQLKFASSELAHDGVFFRLLVESDAGAMPKAIYLAVCDLRSGEILRAWQIRLTDEGEGGIPAFVTPKPPVLLPGLRIETHEEADEREKREHEERERERKRTNITDQRGA
jgi:hypothetical protein